MSFPSELIHSDRLAELCAGGKNENEKIHNKNIHYTAIASLVELAALTCCPDMFISRDEGFGNSGFGEAGDNMAEMYLIWSPEETLKFSLNWNKLSANSSIEYCLVDENMESSIGGEGAISCGKLSDPKAIKSFLEELADVTKEKVDDEENEADDDDPPAPALPDEAREKILWMARSIGQKGSSGGVFGEASPNKGSGKKAPIETEIIAQLPLAHFAELRSIMNSGEKETAEVNNDRLNYVTITALGELSALTAARNITIRPDKGGKGYYAQLMWADGDEGLISIDFTPLRAGDPDIVLSFPDESKKLASDRLSAIGAELLQEGLKHRV